MISTVIGKYGLLMMRIKDLDALLSEIGIKKSSFVGDRGLNIKVPVCRSVASQDMVSNPRLRDLISLGKKLLP